MEHTNEEIRNKGEIMVETPINESVDKVWQMYTQPEHIMRWNHASHEWHCPSAKNDLKVNGAFSYRMEARDGSEGFDFSGTYTEIKPHEFIAFTMDDGRRARIEFMEMGSSTHMRVTFDPEQQNPVAVQKDGWQAILNSFKEYAEKNAARL